MEFKDLEKYFQSLPEKVTGAVPDIVAETAVEYFKETFSKKAFDGNPWKAPMNPKATGSLLVDSGNLLNSIRPAYIGPDKVVISAGNNKVPYARAHNEGFAGTVNVKEHSRITPSGEMTTVASHERTVNIPKRQFMGESDELADKIHNRIEGAIKTIAK